MTQVAKTPPLVINAANPIRATKRIRGPRQWKGMAQETNWALGTGSSLIVAGPHTVEINPGESVTFDYYIWPHEQNIARYWVLSMIVGDNAAGGFEIVGSSTGTWWATARGNTSQSFAFVEAVPTPTATPGPVQCVVENSAVSAGGIIVTGIACYELPRANLTTFTASDVPEDYTCNAKRPILEGPSNDVSIDGVCRAAANAVGEARRACLFSQAWPDGLDISDTTEPADGNVFCIDIPLSVRSLYQGETERLIAWAALYKVTSGTGQVRARPSNGSLPDTFASGATTATWHEGQVLCQTEEISRHGTDGGLRGGVLATMKITAWKSAGGVTMTLYGLCMGEPPP